MALFQPHATRIWTLTSAASGQFYPLIDLAARTNSVAARHGNGNGIDVLSLNVRIAELQLLYRRGVGHKSIVKSIRDPLPGNAQGKLVPINQTAPKIQSCAVLYTRCNLSGATRGDQRKAQRIPNVVMEVRTGADRYRRACLYAAPVVLALRCALSS